MWTTLFMLVCLISTFDLSIARTPFTRESIDERVESKLGNPEESDSPIRLPRKFSKDDETRTSWLHIENQTGFDGKVDTILVDSDKNRPGVYAYGLPNKNLEDNGIIEIISSREDEIIGGRRSGRLVEAYGMSKDRLEDNGEIERIVPPVLVKDESRNSETRRPRSIEPKTKHEIGKKTANDLEDLEAQDAKVFRPLFVYRQQVAKRQNRNRHRNQVHGVRQGYQQPRNNRQYLY